MIREFTERMRILFFPTRWANAVARWIAGIHSKTGTIQISNTLSPGKQGSASFDVNVDVVVERVKNRLGFDRESPMTRSSVRDTVFDLADGASIVNSGRRLSVNGEWIDARIAQTVSQPAATESSDVTFKLAAVKNSGGSVTGMKVYIADTDAIVVRGKSYSLPTGTVAGWNNIGRTGALYLNQKSVGSSETVISQSPDNTPGLFSIYIGSVTANGVVQHTLGKIYTPATSNDYFNDDFFYGGNGLGQNNDNGSLSSGADTLDMRSWTRGTTDYVVMAGSNRVSDPRWTTQRDGFGNTIKPGVTLRVCTRVFRGSYDGQNDAFFFRELKFDKDGCLYSISREVECFMEHNKGWSEFM